MSWLEMSGLFENDCELFSPAGKERWKECRTLSMLRLHNVYLALPSLFLELVIGLPRSRTDIETAKKVGHNNFCVPYRLDSLPRRKTTL